MSTETKTGIDLIAEERKKQIEADGWTLEHDQTHSSGQLRGAAAAYLLWNWSRTDAERFWPFGKKWFRPSVKPFATATNQEVMRDLVKAGALIAAEIDRLNNL